jgi:hypothetical protein
MDASVYVVAPRSQCVVDDAQEEVKRLEAEADRILEEDGPESEVLEGLYARLDAMNPELFESKAAKILCVRRMLLDEELILTLMKCV